MSYTPEEITEILEAYFDSIAHRQYIGSRYVPIFGRVGESSCDWDNTGDYEPLTIVLYQGNSYTSRQFVPAGADISNTDYWVLTGNFNAQVEQYRLRLVAVENALPAADFDGTNTVKKYIDDSVKDVADIIPSSAFDSTDTVKKYIDDSVKDVADIIPSSAFDSTDTVKKYIDHMINGDVEFYTEKGVFNTNYEADWFVVKIKRAAVDLNVKQNNDEYVNAWEATSNAYSWLSAHPECAFAHNCNFSGGETTAAVETGHYPMRYEGVNYEAGSNPPAVRPHLAIDTEHDAIAWYASSVAVEDIPSSYDCAFACSDLLIDNHEVQSGFSEGGYDAQRAAFAWDEQFYYIFYSEGRNTDNRGIELDYIAALFKNMFDPAYAVNLDGGGSVCFAANMPETTQVNGLVRQTMPRGSHRPTTLNMNYTFKDGCKAGESAVAKMAAYAAANHGYVNADLRIATSNNVNHTVVSTDAYCNALSSSGFNIISQSGQDTYGNRSNYDTTQLIIPLKRKYYSQIMKYIAIVKYEGTSDNTKNGYRELQVGIHNFDTNGFTEFYRAYFTPCDNSAITSETAVRDIMQLVGSTVLSETSSSPANIGIELKVQMREGDVLRSVNFEIELTNYA